jgi:hypothetical protein
MPPKKLLPPLPPKQPLNGKGKQTKEGIAPTKKGADAEAVDWKELFDELKASLKDNINKGTMPNLREQAMYLRLISGRCKLFFI